MGEALPHTTGDGEMSDPRLEEFYELVACLLEQIRWTNDAHARSQRNPRDADLYRRASDLSDGLENIKRGVADALIDLNLDMNDRIRAVCPFPHDMPSSGSIRSKP